MLSKIIALGITFVMSLTGLEGISAVTVPVLKVLYPTLILMIVFNLAKWFYKRKDFALS